MTRLWMRMLLAMLLTGLTLAVQAASAARTELPRNVELPVRVRLAVRVLNIGQVQEVAGQARMFIETSQRWSDPRLRFDEVEVGKSRVDRVGDEARDFLKTIWTPGLSADNQTGEVQSYSVAVSAYANGDLVLVERYEGNFRVSMNMAAFPFDKQHLLASFSLPRYAKQEAVLVATEADRQLSGVEDDLSLVDWRPQGLRFSNDEVSGWNARSYSRLNATVTIERLSERFILRIFIPIVAVLLVSVFVLWTPVLQPRDKGNLIFSSLLALAAISFTFESSFPGSISLNTPVAQMISLGYLYLVLVLMLDAVLTSRCSDTGSCHHGLYLAIRWHVNWVLPALMTLICIGAAVRAVPPS